MSSVENEQSLAKHEVEQLGSDFIRYERLCNENNHSARKAGILSAEVHQEIMADSDTIVVQADLLELPVLADIRHGLGLGYDIERASMLAESEGIVSILTVPVGDVDTEIQAVIVEAIANSGPRVIFFADNDGRDSTVLYEGLRARGIHFSEKQLIDERSLPNNQEASLSLFSVDVLPNRGAESIVDHQTFHDIQTHFDQFVYPNIEDPTNACLLRPGDSFDEKELDKIWELYLDRFQYLGLRHPISMEDTKEDFLALFASPDVTVSIKYADSNPVCFTYFTNQFDHLYWLNLPYFQADYESISASQIPIFFPGIVASKESRGANASEVIQTFAKEVASIGIGCRIYFENTNLSEQYVPKIVYRAAVGRAEYSVTEPVKIDQTNYRLIELLSK